MHDPARLPDVDDADELARELLRDLTPWAGNPEAVRGLLLDRLDREDFATFVAACMRAVHLTFAECLTLVPPAEAPPGSLALTPPADRP